MRIGQLARKYNIKQDEIILFLNEVQAELSPFHHNSKLSNDAEELVTGHFGLSATKAVEEEAIEEQTQDIPAEADTPALNESEIDYNKKTEADLQRELDPTLPHIKTVVIKNNDAKSIETDRLLELLEADEAHHELSKITHIKAPKKELSGLKVVGKIALEEPKVKAVDKSENPNTAPAPVRHKRNAGQRLSEEEKTQRRLKEKEKKEQYEARQEKRRIAEEKKKRKALNKARYQEKMQKVKDAQAKQKMLKKEVAPEVDPQAQTFKPMTIFDKFWKLFNL